MTQIFIGMPVYNGERFIRKALESVISQTFTDWTLLISDNNSTDNTLSIIEEFAQIDSRIKYIKQEENIGALKNFNYLAEQAESPYFIWFAADDVWRPEFLESCFNNLEQNPAAGFAFSNIVNTDSFGHIIRDKYPCFTKFCTEDQTLNIIRFILDPELFGKANPIYSLFRYELLKELLKLSFFKDSWGSDMSHNLGALARARFVCDKRVLFEKRIVRDTDKKEFIDKIEVDYENYKYDYPVKQFAQFCEDQLNAVRNTPYYEIVFEILKLRKELVKERQKIAKIKGKCKGLLPLKKIKHFVENLLVKKIKEVR